MIYDANGNILRRYPTLVGDGVTDDTAALQSIVNTYKYVQIPDGLKIKLTSTVEIDTSKISLFDGGNSQFIVSGNFAAFEISGSLVSGMSAEPSTLTDDIIQNESMFVFKNCKIHSAAKNTGCGISISGSFQAVITENYLYELNKGIEVDGVNRNLSINGNNIYKITSYGIHFMPGMNLHQVNTNNNIITYCKYCIFADNVENLINWTCVGNDIEVYDTQNVWQGSNRCIKVYMTDDGTEESAITVLTECVIAGNNIQAHSDALITFELVGTEHKALNHFNITGNHIGNGKTYSLLLDHCKCVSISGNSAVSGSGSEYWVKVANCRDVCITGNSVRSVGGLVIGTGTINGIIVTNNTGEYCSNKVNVTGATVSGSIIKDNMLDGVAS